MKTKTILTTFAAITVAGSVLMVGCGQESSPTVNTQSSPSSTASKGDTGSIVAFTNDKGEIVCPVKGDVIQSADKAFAFQDYKGKRYYFCCGGCPEEFAANPERFAKQ